MSTPKKERIRQAKDWLANNPTESQSVAAKLFKVNKSTLNMAIRRGSKPNSRGGHNKILTASQEQAIHTFIKSYLDNGQLPTKEIIFGAICYIQKQQNRPIPSQSWYRKWWKAQPGLHKIKTKPIAQKRITAQDLEEVKDWFQRFKTAIKKYDIQKHNLYNFDKSGFRIGCPKGVEVLVPIELTELYSLSPENRRSVTMIETICANGKAPIPPVAIVQGKYHMVSWYKDQLEGSEVIHLSESGYTTNHISLRFLEHFIQYTQAGPNQPYKLLLMDNQSCHTNPEFTLLATNNNVVLFTFPAHLTHCMQPLDVGVFQPYKHWHNKAIHNATESLDFEYTIASFFRDLPDIHEKTFKKSTIQHAFKKAGMWPVDQEATFALMKKYVKSEPKKEVQIQYQLGDLKPKVMDLLSSSSQCKFDSFTHGTELVLDESEVIKFDHDIAYQRLQELTIKKLSNQKRIQKGGELTAQAAQIAIAEKEQKEAEKAANKEVRMLRQIANKEKREQKAAWVAWRKKEALRKKAIKQLPRGVVGEVVMYKEYTPPPFPEPGKELIVEQKPLAIPTINSAEIPLHKPPQTPYQQTIRTSFARPELQQEEGESDGSEESYIQLDLEGEFGFSSSSSDSGDSSNSSDSEESSEEGYFKLW
ncbi:hypothetical protein B7463_g10337, partial [Scytalidium lignicola]